MDKNAEEKTVALNKKQGDFPVDAKAENVHDWINTDKKFVKFILGDLFTSGLHAWWLIGLFSIVAMAFVLFAFFASIIDSNYLSANGQQLTGGAFRRLQQYDNLRRQFQADYPALQRLATSAEAKSRLGNPYLPASMLPCTDKAC